MHGTSTAERVVRIASVRARQMGQSTVKAIHVKVAAWSHITADELLECLKRAGQGQPTEHAEVKIEVMAPSARCRDCGNDYSLDSAALRCPSCGSLRVVLDKSREVEVESVEV